jgi:type IX secretion system PorP/SprF family membrane protein
MKKIFYLMIIITLCKTVNAQIVSYDFYSFRLNNMYNVNPSYAAKGEGINAILSAQTQNKGVPNANKNLMFGVYSKVSNSQAIGGKIITDTRGAFQTTKADISFAQIAKLNANSNLIFGISAGVLNSNLSIARIENYDVLDATDPYLSQNYNNNTQFAAGAGLYFNYKTLEVSASMPHLLITNQNVNSYANAAIFYTIKAGDKIKITPWICYQNTPITKSVSSGYLKLMFAEKLWLQAGYQTNSSLSAMFGVNIENLGVGYGFRLSNNRYQSITSGSHEITLSYKFLKNKEQKK